MDHSKASGRRYPVKLVAKFDTMAGQGIAQEKIVDNDAEYNSFYLRYTRERNCFVKEIKTDEVIELERIEKEKQDQTEILNTRKLEIDLRNAERVYSSYRSTRIIAWVGAIIAISVFYLQLAQIFKWWPHGR